jgi:hypothetical protein
MAPAPKTVAATPKTIERMSLVETNNFHINKINQQIHESNLLPITASKDLFQ